MKQKKAKRQNLFSNILSKFTRNKDPSQSSQIGGGKNNNKSGLGNNEQLLIDQMSEFELLQKVVLPAFLLTHEEYGLLTIPQVKNFSIEQRDKTTVMASLKADENDVNLKNKDDELETEPSSVNKKSIIIVTIIVLVAAAFAVGIYFAIEAASKPK